MIPHREFSYFRDYLLSFLKGSHPEKFHDKEMIRARIDYAEELFEQSLRDGVPQIFAHEAAIKSLTQGLHFSKYTTILNILWDEFSDIIKEDYAENLAFRILPFCETLFIKYDISDGFEYTAKFDELYTELVGAILIWLEENEL